MKLLKITILMMALMLYVQASATDFDADSQHFHVDGQSINEALLMVNEIICSIAAMRTDALVNDGPYRATVYDEECGVVEVDASGDAGSATKSSSKSASTATASTTTGATESKTALAAVVNVTRLSSVAPANASVWFKNPAEDEDDFNNKIYAYVSQTAAQSAEAPNGEFEMAFSMHIDGDQASPWDPSYIEEDNQELGSGYIKAAGALLQFRERGRDGDNNIAARFYANGDKSGIYGERAGFSTWDWEANDYQSPEDLGLSWDDYPHTDVEAFYQFYISTADKGYCRRLLSAERKDYKTEEEVQALQQELQGTLDQMYEEANLRIQALVDEANEYLQANPDATMTQEDWDAIYNSEDWDAIQNSVDWDSTWQPTLVLIYDVTSGVDELADYGKSELVIGEECFTVDQAKVQRNVHSYGVYSEDGARVEISNPPFAMVAQVTETLDDNTQVETNAHAWAGYWGTHLDQRVRGLVTDDTIFEKESFRQETDAVKQSYNLKSTDIRLEKRSTSYIALNDLNRISLNMWVADNWWATQYATLFGTTLDYSELEGSFDKDTSTFTMVKGIKHEPQWQEETLATPITFTVDHWKASMFQEWGVSLDGDGNRIEEEWYQKDIKNLGVWSHDTNQWYEISAESMSNPSLATRDAGIRTEKTEVIDLADVTETLYCMDRCLDGAKVEQAFTQAVDPDFTGLVTSPYSNVSERLKEVVTQTRVERGFWSFNEASDGFSETVTTNANKQIVLGDGGVAIIDYVTGNRDLPLYSRGGYSGNDGSSKLFYYAWDGFSKGNIDSLLNYDNTTADQAEIDRLLSTVPSVAIDLESIPAAGTSGTMKMIVQVIKGNDDTQDSGERAVSAEANLRWASDGANFTIAIDQGTEIEYVYVTNSNDIAVSATYTYPRNSVFAYTGGELDIHQSALLRTGLRFKLFDLFVGSGRLQQLISADFGSFFATGDYNASIQMINTDLTVAVSEDGNLTNGMTKATLGFRIYDDAEVLGTETYEAGRYFEGLQLTDMASYSVSGRVLVDQNGSELKKGAVATAALSAANDPSSLLSGAQYANDPYASDGEYVQTNSMAWGIGTSELIPASQLANLECRKNGKDQLYDSHPVYGVSTDVKRYCGYQLWDGGVDVKYSIRIDSHPQYEVFYANAVESDAVIGAKVQIDPPKTMYYTVPNTLTDGVADYGKDAGKRIRLDFNGHGQLWGIPGFVYDTATNEDLGDHITGNWKSTYRYLNRFIMPDGSLIEDGVDSSISYKVKALEGEVWLTRADGTISGVSDLTGKYTDLYTGAQDDLVKEDKLRGLGFEDWATIEPSGNWLNDQPDGVNDNERYLGDEPTPTVNGGETAVVHGTVIFDPTP